jgi:hypothetical protein
VSGCDSGRGGHGTCDVIDSNGAGLLLRCVLYCVHYTVRVVRSSAGVQNCAIVSQTNIKIVSHYRARRAFDNLI